MTFPLKICTYLQCRVVNLYIYYVQCPNLFHHPGTVQLACAIRRGSRNKYLIVFEYILQPPHKWSGCPSPAGLLFIYICLNEKKLEAKIKYLYWRIGLRIYYPIVSLQYSYFACCILYFEKNPHFCCKIIIWSMLLKSCPTYRTHKRWLILKELFSSM